MQVFVPYPDLRRSVECLDKSRLGNQIYRECLTLLNGGWANHPVSKMWWNHSYFLCEYAEAGLRELSLRGLHYPDIYDKVNLIKLSKVDTGPPMWWGDDKVHSCHRANLLRKDQGFYGQYNWEEQPSNEYYYPPFDKAKVAIHATDYVRKQTGQPKLTRPQFVNPLT